VCQRQGTSSSSTCGHVNAMAHHRHLIARSNCRDPLSMGLVPADSAVFCFSSCSARKCGSTSEEAQHDNKPHFVPSQKTLMVMMIQRWECHACMPATAHSEHMTAGTRSLLQGVACQAFRICATHKHHANQQHQQLTSNKRPGSAGAWWHHQRHLHPMQLHTQPPRSTETTAQAAHK
jgi:hypothetical protein